ncbi:MAG: hypothetical protein ACE5LB_04650 [Acidiferrobacterales bacterium]
MAEVIQKVAAIYFVFLGLSYLFHPRLWAEYSKGLLVEPQRMLPILWITLPIGLVIIFVHNIWTGWEIIVTAVGWIIAIKSGFYLLFPHVVKVFANWPTETLRGYIIGGGVFMLAVGFLLVYRYLV